MKQVPKQKKRYRLKFILSDGRKVYASLRGRIEAKTNTNRLERSTLLSWAYTPDLSLSGPQEFFASQNMPFVPVVDAEWEKVSQKIDEGAYIMGGVQVRDLQEPIYHT